MLGDDTLGDIGVDTQGDSCVVTIEHTDVDKTGDASVHTPRITGVLL